MTISKKLDKELVKEVERRCGTSVHASYLETAQYFAKDKFLFMAAGNDGFLAGAFGKKHFRLYAIAVNKDQQGKGIGRKMMRLLIKISKARGLEKITLRTARADTAYKFYQQFGGKIVGVNGDDYEMEIHL